MPRLASLTRTFAGLTAVALLLAFAAVSGSVDNVRADDDRPAAEEARAGAAESDAEDEAAEEVEEAEEADGGGEFRRGRRSRDRAESSRGRRFGPGRASRRMYGGVRSARDYAVIETPLDEEQVKVALDVLDEMQPRVAERLRSLREENPERFEASLSRIGPHALHMANLRENDPQAYELRVRENELGIEAMHLARKARHAADDDDEQAREAVRQELKQILEQQFEVRTQLLEHEMAQVESRLEKLRDQLGEQKQQREQFIERRYELIMRFSRRGFRDTDGTRQRSRDRDRDRSRDRDPPD